MQVLPFILLGIGVDDLFVILRSLEEVDERHPGIAMDLRFRKVLNGAGLSVSVTSLSNIAAFTMGSLTEIPAVRWCGPPLPPRSCGTGRRVGRCSM